MNILYLVPHVPNPTKARSYFHIQGLLNAGHQLTVVTLARNAGDFQKIKRLEQQGCSVLSVKLTKQRILLNCLFAMIFRLPLQAKFAWSPGLMGKIRGYLRDNPTDIIHVEHLRMAQYGLVLMREMPVVWDAVDHLSSLYSVAAQESVSIFWRLISKYEASLLKSYENQLACEFPITLVISDEDQKLFQESNTVLSKVEVARAGLPLETLTATVSRNANTLIITGNMDYHPNVASVLYFVKEIFPLIIYERPDVRLQLVGANPVPTIQALSNERIEITGFVPSLTDYLQRATIAIAPTLYGSGIQNKVIEAFFTETPLVATSTALRSFNVKDNEQVLVRDTPVDFANAVLQLLSDPELQRRIGTSGRRYVEEHHDLKKTTARLVKIYERIITSWQSKQQTLQ